MSLDDGIKFLIDRLTYDVRVHSEVMDRLIDCVVCQRETVLDFFDVWVEKYIRREVG